MNSIGNIQAQWNISKGVNIGNQSIVSGIGKCKVLENNSYTLERIEMGGSISQQQVVNITQKMARYLDIPAKGGYTDEYWEVDMGDEIIRIRKPKDPLADLIEMGKSIKDESIEKAKEKIKQGFIKEVSKKIGEM